jgi:hypothetical protein
MSISSVTHRQLPTPRENKPGEKRLPHTTAQLRSAFAEHVLLLSAVRSGQTSIMATQRIGPFLIFERLWQETGCQEVIKRLLGRRAFEFDVERAIFLTVLHRLCAIGSDRAGQRWKEDYLIDGTDESFDKVCQMLQFLQNLSLGKTQADSLLRQLSGHWQHEFDVLCTLLANPLDNAPVPVVGGLVLPWTIEPYAAAHVQVDDPHDDQFAGPHSCFQLQPHHVRVHRSQDRQRVIHNGSGHGSNWFGFAGLLATTL